MSDLDLAGLGVPLLLLGGVIVIAMATLLLHLLFPPSRHPTRRTGLRIKHTRCPLCGQAMDPLELGGMSVEVCPHCQGIWLSRDTLEQLIS